MAHMKLHTANLITVADVGSSMGFDSSSGADWSRSCTCWVAVQELKLSYHNGYI